MMIDQTLVDETRKYLAENQGIDGLEDHLKDLGFDANPTKIRLVIREMLKEDGYSESEIKIALDQLEI